MYFLTKTLEAFIYVFGWMYMLYVRLLYIHKCSIVNIKKKKSVSFTRAYNFIISILLVKTGEFLFQIWLTLYIDCVFRPLIGANCAEGMEYKSWAPGCLPSCVEPNPQSCDRINSEGCTCTSGYVISGHKCVKSNQCGCFNNKTGDYVPVSKT